MTIVALNNVVNENVSPSYLYPHHKVHEQRVTIHHWQLRDLVLRIDRPQFKNEVIVPVNQDIYRFNVRTGKREYFIRNLGFPPTCMTAGCGYWAAGGQRGDLAVKDLDGQYQMSITTSPNNTINNGVCFAKHNQETRLLVSNNDATIRIYSMPTLQLLETMQFHVAVNFTAVSPDGRRMVVVGDDNKVHLYGSTSSGRYELIDMMAASTDANFSVSWNQSSDKFAVASQDGSVYVWDIRSSNPLCRLGCSGTPSITKNAARCVKFSQTRAVDLLVYSEHVSNIHIVDVRTFDMPQTIRVGPSETDTPITGLTFTEDSQTIFVGTENMILEYGVNAGCRRRFPQGALL